MTLKAGSQSSSGNPARVHTWYKTVFQPLRCATWAWQGALAQKKQKRACGPHQPQPAHQVAKVDVVQILQPSTMDTGPALLTTGPHGNVRPKADPVLMLDNYFLRQRKSPSSLCVQDRGGHVLHYTLTERPWSRLSRPKFVLLFADYSLLATAGLGQRAIWILCPRVEDSTQIPLLNSSESQSPSTLPRYPRRHAGWHRDPLSWM